MGFELASSYFVPLWRKGACTFNPPPPTFGVATSYVQPQKLPAKRRASTYSARERVCEIERHRRLRADKVLLQPLAPGILVRILNLQSGSSVTSVPHTHTNISTGEKRKDLTHRRLIHWLAFPKPFYLLALDVLLFSHICDSIYGLLRVHSQEHVLPLAGLTASHQTTSKPASIHAQRII